MEKTAGRRWKMERSRQRQETAADKCAVHANRGEIQGGKRNESVYNAGREHSTNAAWMES